MAKYCPFCVSKIDQGDYCPFCNNSYTYQIKDHHLRPGTLLNNKYLVGKVLGEGGFGITYVGRDLTLDMKVAIKEYYPSGMAMRTSNTSNTISLFSWSFSNDFAKGKEQFIREAQTIAKMDKESAVVTVRDFFEQNNSAYIVMEFVEGDDLKRVIKQAKKPFESKELLDLTEPLFKALGELHEIGLIHRDISPDNIMIEDGRARLIDFGCARETLNDKNADAVLKHGFSPIEQYENKNMGPWTDVYAMAATIYFCITGKLPPKATERLVKDEIVPPTTLGAKLLPRQENALMKALAVDRSERFQSMEEFGKELFVHRNKYKWIAAIASIVAVAAVVGLLIFKPGTVVETMHSARSITQIYTVEDELNSEELAVMNAVEEAISSSTLEKRSTGSVLNLENTTGNDLVDVWCRFRVCDEEGIIVYDGGSGNYVSWAQGSLISPGYFYSEDDGYTVMAQITYAYGEKTYRTEYVEIPAGESLFSITLVNQLPVTLVYGSYSFETKLEIDSARTNVIYLTDSCYGDVFLSGLCIEGNGSNSYVAYEIMDADGAVYDNGTVFLPKLESGERFKNASISFFSLPFGDYYVTLMDYNTLTD